nr:MAG TPA: hypothetical protein [Bacteriophage sp.]
MHRKGGLRTAPFLCERHRRKGKKVFNYENN